jgi:chemotaxis protein methyltransferase CheR
MKLTSQAESTLASDPAFAALSNYVIKATGLEFYAARPTALSEHIATRLGALGLDDCAAYLAVLHDKLTGETELDQLITRMTIGETYFFRHKELFDALRTVALPEIIERNRATRQLRIWSAGCSTGAEAYSLAFLLRSEFDSLIRGWQVSILGTDINREFLAQASDASYEEWAFRGTMPELRRDCFELCGDRWRVLPRFRQGMTFQYHNLARHNFPSLIHGIFGFDLILCRNVLIYFAPEIVARVAAKLADCLKPDGWLAVGHAEHGDHLRESVEAVHCHGAILYRKPIALRSAAPPDKSKLCENAAVTPVSVAPPRIERRVACHAPVGRARIPHCGRCGTTKPVHPGIEQIRALADQGNMDDALKICIGLIARKPLDAIGHFYQGLLLHQAQRDDAALKALNKAIYLNRDFVLAHYYAGLTQQKLGNTPGAARSFRNVLNMLESRHRSEAVPEAEGMTVADLENLVHLQLETWDAA